MTDITEIDVSKAVRLPQWAGDADVWTPKDDDYVTRATTITGGANIIDSPGGTALDLILTQNVFERDDGTANAYADVTVNGTPDHTIPVSLGYRTAAALALLTFAFDHNAPEPTAAQITELESQLVQLLGGNAA